MSDHRKAFQLGAIGALLFPAIWTLRGRIEIAKDYVLVNVMKRRHTVADRVGQYGFAVSSSCGCLRRPLESDRLIPAIHRPILENCCQQQFSRVPCGKRG